MDKRSAWVQFVVVTNETKQIIRALSKLRDSAREFRDESAKHSPEASHEWACRISAYNKALQVIHEIGEGLCEVAVD